MTNEDVTICYNDKNSIKEGGKIMKRIFLVLFIMFFGFSFTSCGREEKSGAQKGWDMYCEENASAIGVSTKEFKEIIEEGLILHYVFLDETEAYYYEGSYGSRYGTKFYFIYYTDSDVVTTSNAETSYEFAMDLYEEGYEGKSGYLIR